MKPWLARSFQFWTGRVVSDILAPYLRGLATHTGKVAGIQVLFQMYLLDPGPLAPSAGAQLNIERICFS